MASKRKISVTVDEDLLSVLEGTDENLSAQINDAIRVVVDRQRRRQQLRVLLDEFEARDGAVDEAEVERFMDLLA